MTLEAVADELRAIREFLSRVADHRLGRQELAERLGVSVATLDRRVKARTVPAPVNGKWSLAMIVEWEMAQNRSLRGQP